MSLDLPNQHRYVFLIVGLKGFPELDAVIAPLGVLQILILVAPEGIAFLRKSVYEIVIVIFQHMRTVVYIRLVVRGTTRIYAEGGRRKRVIREWLEWRPTRINAENELATFGLPDT